MRDKTLSTTENSVRVSGIPAAIKTRTTSFRLKISIRYIKMEQPQSTITRLQLSKVKCLAYLVQTELESLLCSMSWPWTCKELMAMLRSLKLIWIKLTLANKETRWVCAHSITPSGASSQSTRASTSSDKSKVSTRKISNSKRTSSKTPLISMLTLIPEPKTSVEVTRGSSSVPCH